MPRDLPLGNGNLLINFDASYHLCDLYYPYVGQENHTGGGKCRFGVWVDQYFSWVHDAEWQRTLTYEPETLLTKVSLRNARLGLQLDCTDAVDPHHDLFVRQVNVTDFFGRRRSVRLFFHFDAHLWGHNVGDSVYFDPRTRALMHFKGKRYVLANVQTLERVGFASYATGTKGIHGAEGTWRDAEDGRLSGHAVAQGSIDSVGSCSITLDPHDGQTVSYWLALGTTAAEVNALDAYVRATSPEGILRRTREYWKHWVQRSDRRLELLPEPIRRHFLQSFLILRTQIDNRGAILAANDGDTLQFGRDTYSYMWPRDGALVVDALIRGGYSEVSRRFFEFCAEAISDDGFFWHKYNPDGSPGSSWHPWVDSQGNEELPIQEDETALVLWALWSHYSTFHDLEFIRPLYDRLVRRPAEFLLRFRDQKTGLPLPSHDLWEERRGVHLYTVSAVWAGLRAASSFAQLFGDVALSERCDQGASETRAAILKLMTTADGRFVRALKAGISSELEQDLTIDSSMSGCFLFGAFAPDDPYVVETMRSIDEHLWCRTQIGGIARYEHDYYCRVTEEAPGNPWIVCTLWLAKWHLGRARGASDLTRPLELLQWATDRALPSGVMAEQFNALTGAPESVAPLTWSHASFVTTVLDYLETARAILEPPTLAPAQVHHVETTTGDGVANALTIANGATRKRPSRAPSGRKTPVNRETDPTKPVVHTSGAGE